MLFKTQILHLSHLSPSTIEEAEEMDNLVRAIIINAIHSEVDVDDPDVYRYYLSRRPVVEQMPDLFVEMDPEKEGEVRGLNYHIKRMLEEVTETFRSSFVAKPGNKHILNIEATLANKNNLVISFEIY